MSVVITTYTLASGLMTQGMTWWQAMLTILLGNMIVLHADDPQRARRHEVRHLVSRALPRGVRRARRERARACCARSWRAAGSASRRGSARSRSTRCSRAAWPGWAERAGAASPSRSRSSGCVQVAIILRGIEGIKVLESWSAPLLLVGGVAAARLGHVARRRARRTSSRESARLQRPARRSFWTIFPAGAHGERRLLGDAQPQHPRLHPLRAQPALAGARPGARPADDDDGVRVHRRRGDERDDRDLRRGRSGIPSCSSTTHRQPGGDHLRGARRARGAAHYEHGGERRLAVQRLLQPQPAAHQLRHRRPDHGRDRHR